VFLYHPARPTCAIANSTDRTVELARRYVDQIELIIFEQNRGYGAAIKEAWKETDADLLGFLDADGTCDPRFFADLCNALVKADAGLAVGCRLISTPKCPPFGRLETSFLPAY
jgi:glycosyltransferase involved in cell wall biosynthesis